MDKPPQPSCTTWQPAFDRILQTVRGCGTHGQLLDVREPRRHGALILPPNTDAHVAHRMTRALAALGLVGAGLSDCLVLTGWTPWGPLPQPNAYFSYDGEAERTKEWAIHCHASQVLLTDYT